MNTRILQATVLSMLAGTCWVGAQAAVPAGGQPAIARDPARAEAAFAALDANQDKVLSLQEFRAGHAALQRALALESRLREQFQAVDTNHSGALEAGEYANLALVRRVGGAAPPLTEFDADQDRKLDFPEYLAVVRRLAPAPQAAGAKPGRTDAPSPSRTSD